MKKILLLFLVGLSHLSAQETPATDPQGTSKPEVPQLAPNQLAFSNLAEEERAKFSKHLGEAFRLFQQKRIFEAMEELDNAEKIFSESSELHNLRGTCFTEMRAFKKALVSFEKCEQISPNDMSVSFNVAEIYFVSKKWQEAHDRFQRILDTLSSAKDQGLARLVEFKLLLCKIKLGLKDEVTILSEKYDEWDDSPFYYYAQATMAYEKGDVTVAEEWLARANRIFVDPNVRTSWEDTLVEFGHIKGFYGDSSDSQ